MVYTPTRTVSIYTVTPCTIRTHAHTPAVPTCPTRPARAHIRAGRVWFIAAAYSPNTSFLSDIQRPDELAARTGLLGVLVRVRAVVPLGAGEDWAAGSASSRRRGSGWS